MRGWQAIPGTIRCWLPRASLDNACLLQTGDLFIRHLINKLQQQRLALIVQNAQELERYHAQNKKSKDPNYCVRVTANDGALGDQYLKEFQDNEKSIPTVLTTSQKLSTGVDARNIRNIVLLRPINSLIEFKQIVYGKPEHKRKWERERKRRKREIKRQAKRIAHESITVARL